jgi:23S rRNA (cytosine1962-C5)-methyltransferase
MPLPQITIQPSAAKRLRHFDCWVFRDEVAGAEDGLPSGTVVELVDGDGAFVAYAFYNARAHVAARALSADRDVPWDQALLRARLARAVRRRDAVTGTNARRLVFSEADGLPGLIVDQYADILVLQVRTAGFEAFREEAVRILRRLLKPAGILERSDKEFREEEGLAPASGPLHGDVPPRIQIEEDGLKFWVDPYRGQKTGFYLDQRDTRRLVRSLVRKGERVADVFAYTGAFGIGAAARGAAVVCVEQQEDCLALARENARLNGVEDRMTFVAGNAFSWLETTAAGRSRFDWVLLDPPSLAKSKADLVKGRQALHHLLVQGLGLLAEEATLALSVCTYHLLGVGEDILRIAAAERGVRLRMRGLSLQAPDHPWVLAMPMTRYLMSWLAQRDAPPAA